MFDEELCDSAVEDLFYEIKQYIIKLEEENYRLNEDILALDEWFTDQGLDMYECMESKMK